MTGRLLRGDPLRFGGLCRCRRVRCQPPDHVTVALARPANGPETIDNRPVQPDQALPMLVELVLIAGIAERQRPGHRIEGGLRDRNATTVFSPRLRPRRRTQPLARGTADGRRISLSRRVPRGVIGVISPFNFPLILSMTAEFGTPCYTRIDAPATPAERPGCRNSHRLPSTSRTWPAGPSSRG